jgi:pilus assembly protein Flp/PilA
MYGLVVRYGLDESGASAIEYALVASLISVTIIAAITVIGINLRDKGLEIAEALLS